MKIPPFCPYPGCPNFYRFSETPDTSWYHLHGTYLTEPFGEVKRFKCKACERTFSEQTFSLHYYVKRRIAVEDVLRYVSSGMSIRAMGRALDASTGTVENRISRIARQALVIHERAIEHTLLAEDVVADGFESFISSQYFPHTIQFLTGKESQFVYGFNDLMGRRKGRMREEQKQRRAALDRKVRFEPNAVRRRFAELLFRLLSLTPFPSPTASIPTVFTDEHKGYVAAVQEVKRRLGLKADEGFLHVRISSRKARTTQNRLFSVNYLDREIRKDMAGHRRETTCWDRSRAASNERTAAYVFYRNYLKPFRITNRREPYPVTHAEVAGVKVFNMENDGKRFFSERFFMSREGLNGFFREIWLKTLATPLKQGKEYLPSYALM
jgi:transposase-like protein